MIQSDRNAFTLLELIVTLAVIGMMVGLTSLSLRGHFVRAALMKSSLTASEADRQARLLAQSNPNGIVSLELRPQSSQIVLRPTGRTFSLPTGVRISVDTLGANTPSGGAVPFYGNGTSPSYALKLERSGSNSWLTVLGITGQCILCDEELEVRELLQ